MTTISMAEYEADAQAERNAPPIERPRPWCRREERQTPKPTEADLRRMWREKLSKVMPS